VSETFTHETSGLKETPTGKEHVGQLKQQISCHENKSFVLLSTSLWDPIIRSICEPNWDTLEHLRIGLRCLCQLAAATASVSLNCEKLDFLREDFEFVLRIDGRDIQQVVLCLLCIQTEERVAASLR